MSLLVDQAKLSNESYAKEVYQSYVAQDGEYKVDKATAKLIEDNYSYGTIQKWKSEVTNESSDNCDYDINIDDDEVLNEDKSKIQRKENSDNKRGKIEKWLSLGSGIGALGCGAYVAATMGMGANAVLIGSIGVALAAVTAFVFGMAYLAKKPNEDTHEELQVLQKAMLENDVELANAQIKVQEAKGEVEVIQNEIEETEEEVNEELEAKRKELEEKQARVDELNAKADSEDGLTDEEKSELEALIGEIQTLSEEINSLSEASAEQIEGQEEDLNEEQSKLEESAGVFNSVKDIADYAATFDEAAKESANDEAEAQKINAALGLGSGLAMSIPILGLTPIGQVLRFMALTGGTISAFGAKEQNGFSQDISEEIGTRKAIQSQVQDEMPEVDDTNAKINSTIAEAETVQNSIEVNAEVTEEAIEELDKEVPNEETIAEENEEVAETPETGEAQETGEEEDPEKKPEEEA